MTTPHEIALLRLVAQRLAGPPLPTAAATVRWLTAVQAQDFPGALTSVALRTAAGDRAAVEAALDSGEVVRSWPMRSTLHLVAAEDLGWLLELCGPRVLAGAAKRRAGLGLTEADTERARELAVAALSGGGRLPRAALLRILDDGGVATTGQRGYHLLWYLAQTGTLVLGPTGGGEQLFVLAAEWIPAPRRLDRDAARAELALRFFRGHGPATVADLARWSGLTVTDARAGLAAVRWQLAAVDVDGTEHVLDPATPDLLAQARAQARGVFLLPGFDEFVLGYGDRSAVLAAEFAERIVPGGNGVFRPTVVCDGRIAGTWRWTGKGAKRVLAAEPFEEFADDVRAAIDARAAALP
ncbi:winged helix DNA-binding domain-containing protein [Geodermatophilus sp. SYSU D00815]